MRWISFLLVAGMVTLGAGHARAETGSDGLRSGDTDDATTSRASDESLQAGETPRLQFRMFEPTAEPADEAAAPNLDLTEDVSLGIFNGPAPEDYIGGRGLITTELVTGMFLNPTSGTLSKCSFSIQYCIALLRAGGDTTIGHGGLLAYGLTDDIEVGVGGLMVDRAGNDSLIGVGGPFARLRLLHEDGWIPELSVGFITRFGRSELERYTVFVAASKRFPIDEEGLLRSYRQHVGFRQFWQDSDVNEANGSIVYVGGEVEFPYDLYFVGEVSNKDDFRHTPFSFGMQWRPNETFGISLAGIQNGGVERVSWYIGIGVDF